MTIKTEKELAEALKNSQETIELEGKIKDTVIRIKATGKVTWAIAIGAIGIAVALVLSPVRDPKSQVASKISGFAAASGAVAILGSGATYAAISIAVAAGGIGALNSLRDYKIVSSNGEKLILRKS
ncbi:hypothetical protein CLI92_02740 [Vandammella animalimorsus]|uniref:Uncharacterized protein n=1 Tax=Vandammella animalimorsus TaxID=2029117 RepID=A0A2A2A5X8_9BURK|nr:hypothetical protein [Vandammella animalimorsus]PAT32741.1 hypothetical protein CK626_03500 [Vandammella animalimorsus]PAT33930.1 hypothetical protein CK625_13330 [Vandammella animalimorsus]PAX17772.1 hypothetical protein CLI92_02740 [Vandammella animalimorsus]PAX19926.1 hypothetical protein CLI93_04165 [Vandammella animalimorsus]